MSWLFSRALVEAYLPASCSGGEPCAPLNVMPTPHPFWRNDKMMAPSSLSRFGVTCAVLTEDHGEAVLTSYLAAFPARTSAPPEREPESRESEAGSGKSLPASFARYDPVTSSWKTAQCSLLAGLDEFSETWPRWGMMRNGECWELPTLVVSTYAKEYGYWPTPQASDGMRARMTISSMGKIQPDARGGRSYLSRVLAQEFGLLQSAEFTEWLMNWPIGWTDLKPLEMDRFREWQQKHGFY